MTYRFVLLFFFDRTVTASHSKAYIYIYDVVCKLHMTYGSQNYELLCNFQCLTVYPAWTAPSNPHERHNAMTASMWLQSTNDIQINPNAAPYRPMELNNFLAVTFEIHLCLVKVSESQPEILATIAMMR